MDGSIVLSDLKTTARNGSYSFKSENITGHAKVHIIESKNIIMKVLRSCNAT